MAKTPKLKKGAQSTTSLHPRSRAARRAAPDPTLNIDKSLLLTSPPSSHALPHLPPSSILSARPGSGISKTTKGKRVSRQQRLRREKGLEKAEGVMGKRERKVERSLGREVLGRERGVPWDELNRKIGGTTKTTTTTTTTTTTGGKGRSRKMGVGVEDEGEWMDEDEDGDIGGRKQEEGPHAHAKSDGERAPAGVAEISLRVGEDAVGRDQAGEGEDEVL